MLGLLWVLEANPACRPPNKPKLRVRSARPECVQHTSARAVLPSTFPLEQRETRPLKDHTPHALAALQIIAANKDPNATWWSGLNQYAGALFLAQEASGCLPSPKPFLCTARCPAQACLPLPGPALNRCT